MQGRGNKKVTGKQEPTDLFSYIKGWHIWLVMIVGISLAAYLSLKAMQEAYTVVPSKVFLENFNDKLSDIKDLEGGGELSSYFTLHLKFKAPHGAHPKHYTQFRDEFPTQAVDYFRQVHPNDAELVDPNQLELQSRSEHNSASSIINSWLLHIRKTDQYYFRTWGQK